MLQQICINVINVLNVQFHKIYILNVQFHESYKLKCTVS